MAQRIHTVLVDDIDGSDATQTVQFSFDGTTYEIDLNDEHAATLRDDLSKWSGQARKVTTPRRAGAAQPRRGTAAPRATRRASRGQNDELREWARNNGYEVKERGRVPEAVRQAYEAAQGR